MGTYSEQHALASCLLTALRQAAKPWRERMAVGHYVHREREGQEMTLTELARRVEISIAYLSRIERGRENPPPDRLVSALAGALGLPPDALFAAARRLPPDLRARTDDVIAGYRQQTARRGRELCGILGDEAIRRRGLTALQ